MAAMAAGAQGALEQIGSNFGGARKSLFTRPSLSVMDFDKASKASMRIAGDTKSSNHLKRKEEPRFEPHARKQNSNLSDKLERKIKELRELAVVETRNLEKQVDSLQSQCSSLRDLLSRNDSGRNGQEKKASLRVSVTSYASSFGSSQLEVNEVSPKHAYKRDLSMIADHDQDGNGDASGYSSDSDTGTPRPPCQPRASPHLVTGKAHSSGLAAIAGDSDEPMGSPAPPGVSGFGINDAPLRPPGRRSLQSSNESSIDENVADYGDEFFAEESEPKKKFSIPQRENPFRLWAIWQDDEFRSQPSLRTQSLHDVALDDAKFFKMVQQGHQIRRNYRCIISPTSRFNFSWDMLFIILISYDFVVVPLAVFDPDETGFTLAMSWVTRFYWTLSIPISTRTAFINEEGSVENRPFMIMRNYMATWMFFDILVVSVDWLAVALSSLDVVGSVRFVRTTRILRAVRVLRLARLFKLPAVLESIQTRTYFEKARLLLGIAKISVCIMGIAHCIACFWYAAGDNGWVPLHFQDPSGESVSIRYAVCLHWAMTQFIGNIDIYAVSYKERIFSICVLTFCFFASAAFVSQFTASLTRLSIISGSQARQFAMLRRFLDYKHISTPLSLRVTQSARYVLSQLDKYMNEKDVELLGKISGPLLQEIHYEVNVVVLTSHPFFRRYHHWNAVAVRKLCHFAAQSASLAMGDILFTEGESPTRPKMFFLCHGLGFYIKYGVKEPATFNEGMWACEMCLWVPWVHRGTLRAASNCTILALDVDTFHKTALEFHGPVFHPALYARIVFEHLNNTGECATNSDTVLGLLPSSTSQDTQDTEMPSELLDGRWVKEEKSNPSNEEQESPAKEERVSCIDDLQYGSLNIERVVMSVFPHHLSRKEKASDHSIGSLLRRMSLTTPGTDEGNTDELEYQHAESGAVIESLAKGS